MLAVDYNSWVESEKGLRLAASLDKDVILAEGIIAMGERTLLACLLACWLDADNLQGTRSTIPVGNTS